MVFPRMRARVAGALFVLWLGLLAYLALSNRGRIVVARPQLERSNLVVLAALTDDEGRPAARIAIQKVLYAENPEWRQLAGRRLELKELAFFSAAEGWDGPGDYVVPLARSADADEVALLPMSPGYFPATSEYRVRVGPHRDRLASDLAGIVEMPPRRLRELFDARTATLWHVPVRVHAEFESAVRAAGGEVLGRRFAEARIYRATPDVLEQVDAIVR